MVQSGLRLLNTAGQGEKKSHTRLNSTTLNPWNILPWSTFFSILVTTQNPTSSLQISDTLLLPIACSPDDSAS